MNGRNGSDRNGSGRKSTFKRSRLIQKVINGSGLSFDRLEACFGSSVVMLRYPHLTNKNPEDPQYKENDRSIVELLRRGNVFYCYAGFGKEAPVLITPNFIVMKPRSVGATTLGAVMVSPSLGKTTVVYHTQKYLKDEYASIYFQASTESEVIRKINRIIDNRIMM